MVRQNNKYTQEITIPFYGEVSVNKCGRNNMWYIMGVYDNANNVLGGVYISWEPETGWGFPYKFSYSDRLRPHLESIGTEILSNPYFKAKFNEWAKNATKRLEVSVPRLKAEYEAAKTRLDAFNAFKL